MSSNLAGQVIVVIGGSSGIGYGVAKAVLLQEAARVVIGSSNKAKVENAVERLRADVASASVVGTISGDVVDGNDASSIKTFLSNIGEIDHLVWTSGDKLKFEEDGTVAGNSKTPIEPRANGLDYLQYKCRLIQRTVLGSRDCS